MKFYSWQTDFDIFREKHPKRQHLPYDEFYKMRVQDAKDYGVKPLGIMYDHEWLQVGRPYYNIHPGMVNKLSKINLDKIPSNLVQMPHDTHCVNLRFAAPNENFVLKEAQVDLNPKSWTIDMPAGSWLRNILMLDHRVAGQTPHIGMLFDFGVRKETQNAPGKVYTRILLQLDARLSLQQSLEECVQLEAKNSFFKALETGVKIAASIGFLANSRADLVEYDVLSKFKEQFDKGDEATKQNIIRKSRQRGKIGYNVGNDLMFLGALPRQGAQQAGEGRELQYAHIREGHPHAVRYGEGRSLVKIMWFKPMVVRNDLPFKK